MSIRTCPRCGRLTFDQDLQRNEWRCTVRSCDYREPIGDPVAHLRAENIRLRQQLADVETSDLTIAVQERAELRDQMDALTLRLQASEEQRFRAEAQVRRVREALDDVDARGAMLHISALQEQYWYDAMDVSRRIRAALDQEVPDE